MKKFSRILCVALSLVMVLTVFGALAGCPVQIVESDKVTVRFMSKGSEWRKQEITKGTAVAEPAAAPTCPAEEIFVRWYKDGTASSVAYNFSTPVDADLVLNAYFTTDWVPITLMVRKEDTGLETDTTLTVIKAERNWLLSEPKNLDCGVEDKGIDFWKNGDGTPFSWVDFKPSAALTLYAVLVDEWTITLDTTGGTLLDPVKVRAGDTITAPANPTQTGFDFVNWVYGSSKFDFATAEVNKSFTVRAKWKQNSSFKIDEKTLVLNSGELDGILSPFFSSSGNDSNVHGQTQVSMLSSDSKGNLDMGIHTPSVALDYTQDTYIFKNNKLTKNPSQEEIKDLSDSEKNDSNKFYTEYKFLIKNGIKFSDGKPLTIKDVVFNMYVYLDPCYTGSSTMYSTPIKGLRSYRRQIKNLTDGKIVGDPYEQEFIDQANRRRLAIRDCFSSNSDTRTTYRQSNAGNEDEYQLIKDVQWLREELWRELQADWVAAKGITLSVDNTDPALRKYRTGYEDEEFTEPWEIFLKWYDFITVQYEPSGKVKKDGEGNKLIDRSACDGWYKDEVNLIKIVYNSLVGVYSNSEKGNSLDSDAERAKWSGDLKYPQVDLVFDSETKAVKGSHLELGDLRNLTQEQRTAYLADNTKLVSRFYSLSNNAVLSNISKVAYYMNSGSNAITAWTADEKSKALDRIIGQGDEKLVPTVEGITVELVDEFKGQMGTEKGAAGEDYSFDDGDEHYVLSVTILGVDPKAIWNFGFAVTPMHYYSNIVGKTNPGSMFNSTHDYRGFNYPGIVGNTWGIAANEGYDSSKNISPGFKNLNSDYFNNIFKDSTLMQLPVGAGAYMATDSGNSDSPKPSGFVSNNMVYYKANTHFDTTGELITSPKFRNLRYMIIESTKVLNTLETSKNGGLAFGEVNAKEENLQTAKDISYLTPVQINNNGYGYVGVNAKYVPNINVRKAIMTAMNTQLVKTYYQSMAQIIYRPMSINSWAYPTGATDRYPFKDSGAATTEIKRLISNDGYSVKNGCLERVDPNTSKTDRLEYTFTIAGAEKDHPAYNMFVSAANILNAIGFKIKVYPDSQALIKLASGELSVWAAAWSSSIDPDMYQVYHKESQAQSVNNWGYPYLIKEKNGTQAELKIIDDLSQAIEEGRSVLDRESRTAKYKTALDLVMELAVEYPTYQRYNLVVYNHEIIDASTLNQDISAWSGLLDRIWEIRLLK